MDAIGLRAIGLESSSPQLSNRARHRSVSLGDARAAYSRNNPARNTHTRTRTWPSAVRSSFSDASCAHVSQGAASCVALSSALSSMGSEAVGA